MWNFSFIFRYYARLKIKGLQVASAIHQMFDRMNLRIIAHLRMVQWLGSRFEITEKKLNSQNAIFEDNKNDITSI